jgi:hypothetical protein
MDFWRRVERGWIRVGMFVLKVWMSGDSRVRVSSWSVWMMEPGGAERNRFIIARLSWCWMMLDMVVCERGGF